MRRILILCCLLAGLFGVTFASAQAGFQVAPPQRFVTDIPGFLTRETRDDIDRRLALHQQRTGQQILVWIGNSTNGVPLEDWTVQALQSWKVGRAKLDDGLVLFIFAEDHKIRIEVGYGLEGQIPDAIASQIIREIIEPELKRNNRDKAITAGVDQILKFVGGDNATGSVSQSRNKPMGIGSRIAIAILGLAILMLIVKHPSLAIWILYSILSGGRGGGSGGGGNDDNRYSGGGGRSGGGGSSGSW